MRALIVAVAFVAASPSVSAAQSWRLDTIADTFVFAEGPARFDGALIVSDVRADRMVRVEADGRAEPFREPSEFANGNTVDAQGRLVTAEHAGRVVRREASGLLTVLAERYEGKRLNSPNDVMPGPDGAIWFTDPTFGLQPPFGRSAREAELQVCGVYRIDPSGITLQISGLEQPNGIAFARDGRTLFVSDSASGRVHAYPVREGRAIEAQGRVIATFPAAREAVIDGLGIDAFGRLLVAEPLGVTILSEDGRLLDRIPTPVPPTDVLADPSGDLWITARTHLYRAVRTSRTETTP